MPAMSQNEVVIIDRQTITKRPVDPQRNLIAGVDTDAITERRKANKTVELMITVFAAARDMKKEIYFSGSVN